MIEESGINLPACKGHLSSVLLRSFEGRQTRKRWLWECCVLVEDVKITLSPEVFLTILFSLLRLKLPSARFFCTTDSSIVSVEVFRHMIGDGTKRRVPAVFLTFSYTEWENLREMGHLDDLGIDERIVLKLIFKK
jgi:hypothetical protein